MLNAIRKLDDAIIGYLNTAYLWVWDRTGITVAMIAFPVWAILTFVANDMAPGGIAYFFFGIVGLAMSRNHYLQTSGFFEAFNNIAQSWHNGFARRGVIVAILAISAGSIFRLFEARWYTSVTDLLFIFLMQFLCVKIRKREPPEKHVFVPEGAN